MKLKFAAILLIMTGAAWAQGPRGVHVQAEKATSGKDRIARSSIGHMEAVRTVNVRSAVEGFLLEPEFEEGSIVKEGDVLFRIHPVRYEAAVRQCESALAELSAKITYAENNYQRLARLSASQAASEEHTETAFAQLEELRARVAEAKADLVKARKDLEDCTIRAEISGRIGRRDASRGSYIARGEILATIKQMDPIYVRFPLSQSDVNGIFRGPKKIAELADVRLTTADGRRYSTAGQISIVDNLLTGNTDSYTLWAQFDNKERMLTPRGIGALSISLRDTEEVTMVPLTAVQHDAKGDFVYTVAEDGAVARREVVSGGIQGRFQAIYEGLQPGEVVITDGSHKTRAGDKVIPVFPKTPSASGESQAPSAQLMAEPIESKVAAVTMTTDPTVLTCQGARVEAINRVELRPLVQGLLGEPSFREGDMVKEGDVLFQIDATRYQAAVDAQRAKIAQLTVKVDDARKKFERQQYLVERAASSKDQLESAQATLEQLKAQRESAEAALAVAEDDLSRCTVRAPMTARVGRVHFSRGNYITDINSSLATLVQLSPIYVRFPLSENRILSTYGNDEALLRQADIRLNTSTGTSYAEAGNLAFADNIVQTETDTQNLWASFPNAEGKLQPGAVVTIELRRKPEFQVPAVPSEAIQTDTRGHFVYKLVEGRALLTRVICGSVTEDGHTVVFDGLTEGDQVLTSNLAEMENGAIVTPLP